MTHIIFEHIRLNDLKAVEEILEKDSLVVYELEDDFPNMSPFAFAAWEGKYGFALSIFKNHKELLLSDELENVIALISLRKPIEELNTEELTLLDNELKTLKAERPELFLEEEEKNVKC